MEFQLSYFKSWNMMCESAALNMPENLENSAVATGLEKISFYFILFFNKTNTVLVLPYIKMNPFPPTWPNKTDCPHSLTSAGGHRPGENMPVLLPQGSPQCGSSLGKRGYFTPSSWQLLNMEQDIVSGRSQFSFYSQRRAMPMNIQTTIQLFSFHMLAS